MRPVTVRQPGQAYDLGALLLTLNITGATTMKKYCITKNMTEYGFFCDDSVLLMYPTNSINKPIVTGMKYQVLYLNNRNECRMSAMRKSARAKAQTIMLGT